jgi:hypothetical protein
MSLIGVPATSGPDRCRDHPLLTKRSGPVDLRAFAITVGAVASRADSAIWPTPERDTALAR